MISARVNILNLRKYKIRLNIQFTLLDIDSIKNSLQILNLVASTFSDSIIL